MSDFLVSFDRAFRGASLLALLKQPYGGRSISGRCSQSSWAAWAVLNDRIARGNNSLSGSGVSASWVGDLVPEGRAALQAFLHTLVSADRSALTDDQFRHWFESVSDRLNGAFAAVLIAEEFVCVITDPMGAVQVYLGRNRDGAPAAVGTHADVVARCADEKDRIDAVSVCDFLNTGTPCWPFTMHEHVKELRPGTLHVFSNSQDVTRHAEIPYWHPPAELNGSANETDLAEEFVARWQRAVRSRCDGSSVAVQLSGGLDSRLVLAAIPPEKRCVTLTLCDEINREAGIARQVAAAYGREWATLQRDPEYVGQTALESTRYIGCEGEWHHAHALGFADRINASGVEDVFTGLYMDNNFKGYYAKDLVRIPRLRGLLPASYEVRNRDYVNRINDFCRRHVRAGIVESSIQRRKTFHDTHFASARESTWEWLDGYPLTQASDNTGWMVERRVMPLRLPVMDRALVDLAFRVPIRLKAGGRFFLTCAKRILGRGNWIPNANDGTNPGSGQFARLVQRCRRETANSARQYLSRIGVRMGVPHSWHDYQAYWRESTALRELIQQHGKNLEYIEGALSINWQGLLHPADLPWRIGCRVVQLAVWLSLFGHYRLPSADLDHSTAVAAHGH